jgi:cytochrome b6-f complex iron-sulfur subunit
MNRKEFFKQAGLSAATILTISNPVSCAKNTPAANNSKVNFTIDLNDPANAALTANGDFLYKNGVIVARTENGGYIAVSQACTHQGATVQYDATNNDFYCPVHGSVFAANGNVLMGPAATKLQQYNVSQSGSSLRVYS